MRSRRFFLDERGLTAVETAMLAPVVFAAVLSTVDLALYAWRWNQAVEAVRLGARLAAVSDPVASDLSAMTGLETGATAGQPANAYERVCAAATQTCTNGAYSAPAMSRLLYGPGSTGCDDATSSDARGMCDVLGILDPGDVTVTYRASGVDAVGTVGALKPLVTVRIQNAGPRLVIFDRILPLNLPITEATALAEDMRSSG